MDIEARLKEEARFQNARVTDGGEEARDKYYVLLRNAFKRYDEALGELTGKRVVVVGCSDVGVLPLARRGANVIGIDVADEAVAQLNEQIAREGFADRAKGMVMNAEDLTFEPGSVDMIVCTGVLHHLDVEKSAKTFSKVLKSDGRVVMMEPLAWNPAAALYRQVTPSMRTEFEHPLKPIDLQILRRHFSKVEFSGHAFLSCLAIPFTFIPGANRLKETLVGLLDPIDQALFKAVPFTKYFAWTTVIVCERPSAR
jgi:SAM-dependent methyltransferase